MKQVGLKIVAIVLVILAISSCGKDDILKTFTDKGSATVNFRGETFTVFDDQSFGMTNGMIAVTNSTDDYQLTASGIGKDGSTVDVCWNSSICTDLVTVHFSTDKWGTGLSAYYSAMSGTIKRNGRTLTINAQVTNDGGQTMHTLTATVKLSTIINL